MPSLFSVDISEKALHNLLKEDTFNILLQDHTRTDMAGISQNIIWATQDYSRLGKSYGEQDMITAEAILGEKRVIVPRSVKNSDIRKLRTHDKAEVFTPAWICNAQNNLIDEDWFSRKDVFNTVNPDNRQWKSTQGKIEFPEGKTWKDYVGDIRLEITCGEAPYLISRYDATNGDFIPIEQRIGLFDRKMRVVNENTETEEQWVAATRKALESCYGFEWQGDNLFIARENMLISAIEYFQHKFRTDKFPAKCKNGKSPINIFANIISWNLWQMDGLTGQLPYSEKKEYIPNPLFEEDNNSFCKIMDWNKSKTVYFVSLKKGK